MSRKPDRGSDPIRTCIGCRARRPQCDLRRVTVDGDGRLSGGPGGRGAWLCSATLSDCFDAARRRKAFGRALRSEIGPEEISRLFETGFLDCGLEDLGR